MLRVLQVQKTNTGSAFTVHRATNSVTPVSDQFDSSERSSFSLTSGSLRTRSETDRIVLKHLDEDFLKRSVMTCSRQNAYAWAAMESIVTQYNRLTLNRFESLVTGLCSVVILYIGFYIFAFIDGWHVTLSGHCLVLVAGYTVTVGGIYVIFPIIMFGARTNACIDLSVAQGKNIAWYCGLQSDNEEYQEAAETWDLVAGRHEEHKNVMTVLMIPVTPALMKSMVLLVFSTLSSALLIQLAGVLPEATQGLVELP